MKVDEHPIVISVGEESLLGIVSQTHGRRDIGVLIVVGGPQYRVGSHRQFVLLARDVAAAGFPVMRFDYRGMGDSYGEPRSFESVDTDIKAAIDAFSEFCPTISRIVLWGLCDGASASLMYWDRTRDPRVSGMVLLNPWVRSEASLAKTRIKHYYVQRLFQVEFWKKLVSGKVGIVRSATEYFHNFSKALNGGGRSEDTEAVPFQRRMTRALSSFQGPVLVVLSENDYTAKEFLQYARDDDDLRGALGRSNVGKEIVFEADHTFSSTAWRDAVSLATRRFLQGVGGVRK